MPLPKELNKAVHDSYQQLQQDSGSPRFQCRNCNLEFAASSVTRQHITGSGRDVATCLMPDSELKSQLLAKEAERKRTTSLEDSPRQKQRGAAEVHVEELDDLRKRNRDASDSEVDRELEAQPEPSPAQQAKKASGKARRDRHNKNTWHAKKFKLHTVMKGVSAAGLEAGAVEASGVVEARLVTQIEAQVEASSMRALLASLLLGLIMRGFLRRVTMLPDGQETFEDIPAEDANIPNLAERNLFLQLGRGLPPPCRQSRPSAAVGTMLATYPDLHRRLNEVPRWARSWRQALPTASPSSHHIKLDTKALFAFMRTASMLPADITSLPKFRSGVVTRDGELKLGPKDSEVANRWNAFLPNLAALRPNRDQTFAQVVHIDGVAASLMFTRPKPAEPPGELPRMGKEEGVVNPLAYLDADWLGCDRGKTNMATVAHEERYPSGAVQSV
ncbi:hypothetical protein QJQ45_020000 [Haematococcus lacustris]|nr:hypothetical protein QJQ45_020000 [Haematococcus lacustris]